MGIKMGKTSKNGQMPIKIGTLAALVAAKVVSFLPKKWNIQYVSKIVK
jgi:hypothetical protein